MTQGRSIRLFLVDGTSRGLLTAKIVNWTDHVLTGLVSRLGKVMQRFKCAGTSVSSLVDSDPQGPNKPFVYVGAKGSIKNSRLHQAFIERDKRALP